MSLVKIIELDELKHFFRDNSYLSIVKRNEPQEAKNFFKEILIKPFNFELQVFRGSILENIRDVLDKIISKSLINKSIYSVWTGDMAKICKIYCDMLNADSICFSLSSSRSCKRFHIDNVSVRLLVTYYGIGTEWVPSNACDYSAYFNGKNNNEIIKDTSAIKFMNTWDIAIFKGNKFLGNEKGILHRTPYAAMNSSSILMRLDCKSLL